MNMSTFIWIVVFRSIVLTSTQPVISPDGSVVVKERSNLTLTCSYKGTPVDKDTICVWSEKPIGKDHLITRLQLTQPRGSICTEFVHYKQLYGYQCLENSVFTITLRNVSRDMNGTQWICEMMFGGEAATRSNIITLLVKDHPANKPSQVVTGLPKVMSSSYDNTELSASLSRKTDTTLNLRNVTDSSINSPKEFYTTKDFSITTTLNAAFTEKSEVESDAPGVSHRDFSRLQTYIIIGIAACSIVCIIIGFGATYIVFHLKASRRLRRHVSNTIMESDINTVEGQNQLISVSPRYEQLQLRSEALYTSIIVNN